MMENLNKNQFNIEKTTMRELTSNEINDVAGGTTGVILPIITTIIISTSMLTTLTGEGDEDPN